MKPYYDVIEGPGVEGKIIEHNRFYISSEPMKYSDWTRPITNPYRELSYGGTTIGFKGINYWISDTTFIGKILRRII